METEADRQMRRSVRGTWPRAAALLAGAYALNYLHTFVRPHILPALPNADIRYFYTVLVRGILLGITVTSVMWLVVCYYYHLRDRRLHTAMSEFGLAARSSVAGLLALLGFVLALMINDGIFTPR